MPVTPPTARAADHFRRAFGSTPTALAHAPGRVNLIGEHTDYNDGFVLPIAIDAWCAVAASPSSHPRTRVQAIDLAQSCELPPLNAVNASPPATNLDTPPRPSWSRYIDGVLTLLAATHPHPLPPLDLAFTSTIPIGGGLSSSAALEVAVALAALRAWDLSPSAPLDLARLCQRAEHDFAGVPCGLMDQVASLLARAAHAMHLDCRSLTIDHIPIPDSLRVVVVDTGVRHDLASGAYAARREQCRLAAQALGLPSLRDATPAQVDSLADPLLRRRARHVVSEIDRVRLTVAALRASDPAVIALLLAASHASLRDDYEVSCSELDAAVRALIRFPGVLGARMTGGGFGGCVVALVDPDAADRIARLAISDHLGISARVVTPTAGAWESVALSEGGTATPRARRPDSPQA